MTSSAYEYGNGKNASQDWNNSSNDDLTNINGSLAITDTDMEAHYGDEMHELLSDNSADSTATTTTTPKPAGCHRHDSTRRRKIVTRLILTPLIVLFSVWIGAFTQHIRAGRIPDTVGLYQTGRVCGMEYPQRLLQEMQHDSIDDVSSVDNNNNNNNSSLEPISILTFDSAEQANSIPNATVAHCGDCGACSNPHDIKKYDDTKDTLFEDSLACSKLGVLSGADEVRDCLQERVGLTEDCNECWVENIMCDVRNCLFVCMWQAMFNNVDSNKNNDQKQQELNACTQCDEKRCGPAFVKCAGANRRRTGIVSEFKRDNDEEVCHQVEQGWWQNDVLQEYYSQQAGLDNEH